MELKPAANRRTRHNSHSMEPVEKELCARCSSRDKKDFNAEVAIHFTGIEGLNKPIVWVFPKMQVCLNCGTTTFTVPERELCVLVDANPVEGALIWPEVA